MIDIKKYLDFIKNKINEAGLSKKNTEELVLMTIVGENVYKNAPEQVEKYRKNIKTNLKEGVLTIETKNPLIKSNIYIKKESIERELKEKSQGKIVVLKIV